MEHHIRTIRSLQRQLETLEKRTRELLARGEQLLSEAEGVKPHKPARAAAPRRTRKPATRTAR